MIVMCLWLYMYNINGLCNQVFRINKLELWDTERQQRVVSVGITTGQWNPCRSQIQVSWVQVRVGIWSLVTNLYLWHGCSGFASMSESAQHSLSPQSFPFFFSFMLASVPHFPWSLFSCSLGLALHLWHPRHTTAFQAHHLNHLQFLSFLYWCICASLSSAFHLSWTVHFYPYLVYLLWWKQTGTVLFGHLPWISSQPCHLMQLSYMLHFNAWSPHWCLWQVLEFWSPSILFLVCSKSLSKVNDFLTGQWFIIHPDHATSMVPLE